MAPFLIIWALVWIIIHFPPLPVRPAPPLVIVKFVAALLFVIYCIIVLLVDTGSLHMPVWR